MKKVKYCLLVLTLFLVSCYNDIDDVNIYGKITDSISQKPIENVRVHIICWRYGNTPDGSYTGQDSITVTTNKEGRYSHNFNKGAFIEIKTSISGYQDRHESTDITTKNNTMDLKLKSNDK